MTGIIIGGAARAGKSQLAHRLHAETGFSWISGDMLVSTFGGIFPELGIHHEDKHKTITDRFFPFARAYMNLHTEWEERPFIFESLHMTPEKIVADKLHEKYAVVFLGYPNLTVPEKLKLVRQHDPEDDWTAPETDQALGAKLGEFIDLSKNFRDECTKHGLTFYDTGDDFEVESEKAYQFILSHL